MQYDLNPGLRINTTRTGTVNRTDTLGLASRLGLSPFTGSVFTLKNLGREQYDGLNLSFEKRFSRGWASRVSYTIARSYDDSAQNNYQVLDASFADLAWGPSGRTAYPEPERPGRDAADPRPEPERHVSLHGRHAVYVDQLQRGRRP